MRQKSEWDDTWLRSFLLLGTVWILAVRARYGQNLMVSGFGGYDHGVHRVGGDAPCRGKRLEIQEVAKVEREATGIGPGELGLTLADGKTVLKQVQARIVQIQIEAISAAAKATVRDLRVLAQVWCKRYAGLVP